MFKYCLVNYAHLSIYSKYDELVVQSPGRLIYLPNKFGGLDKSGQVGGLIRTGKLTGYPAYTSGLSTWWSTRSLIGISDLGRGFTLRCFQRLSCPYIATQRCA